MDEESKFCVLEDECLYSYLNMFSEIRIVEI